MTLEELALALVGAQVTTILVLALRTQRQLGRIAGRLEEHERRIVRLEAHTEHARAAGADSRGAH